MANRIKIRHGSGTPSTSQLLPYELGWDYTNKILYINNNNSITNIINSVSNTWAAGTTAGPTIKTTVNGVSGTAVAIPIASATASGVVTTGAQTFAGIKTFTNPETINTTGNGAGFNFKFSNAATANGMYGANWINYENTSGRFYWREWSGSSSGRTNYYEQYRLPACDASRTSDVTYNIITTKNPGDLYWANINVASSSSTTTEPTFGLIRSTKNSNTTTIGSQNASFCHIYNSANIPFIFNNTVETTTGNLGTTTYPWNNLYLGKANGAGIYYQGTKNVYRMIRFIDNTNDVYGNGISIGGGGQTIIGGGESADTMVAQAGTAGGEMMWVGNDGDINFYSNLQNGWDSRKIFTMNTSGQLIVNGSSVIRDSGTTARRIFLTTSASVPSGAVAGDIVLVKV